MSRKWPLGSPNDAEYDEDFTTGYPTGLSEEQAKFVEKMDAFQDAMDKRVFDATFRLNGTRDVEERNFEFETSDSVVKVARGSVVEKGGFRRTGIGLLYGTMSGGTRGGDGRSH